MSGKRRLIFGFVVALAVLGVAVFAIASTGKLQYVQNSQPSAEGGLATQVSIKENVTAEELSQLPKSEEVAEEDANVSYQGDKIIVSFNETAFDGKELNSYAKNVLAGIMSVSEGDPVSIDEKTAVLTVREGASVSQAVQEVSGNSDIAFSQPNYIYTLAGANENGELDATETENATNDVATTTGFFDYTATNDPLATEQWMISNWWEPVTKAWEIQKGDGVEQPVTVAVLDTGVDTDHEDLKDNLVGAVSVTKNKWGETEGDPEDVYFHGTHCAGIVAATSNNGIGVTGVSHNSKVYSIRTFKYAYWDYYNYTLGCTSQEIADGIKEAIDKKDTYNIRVISMSLGIAGTSKATGASLDQLVKNQVTAATNEGISIVAASGNESASSPNFPSYLDNVIAVGAIDRNGNRCNFSNYGEDLDVVAPGYKIYSTTPQDYYDANYRNYASLNGTSMATPYVAATLALMYSANPDLTPAEAEEILITTTGDEGNEAKSYNTATGYGKVNPWNALKKIKGDSKTEVCKHSRYTYNQRVEATCTKEGKAYEIVCSDCGVTILGGETIAIDSSNHTALRDVEAKSSTCSEAGYSAHQHCDDCGADINKRTRPLNSRNHSDLVTVEAQEQTCTEDGWNQHQHCNGCGMDVGKKTQKATGHKPVEEGKTAATCTTSGWEGKLVCSVCNVVTDWGRQIPLDYSNHSALVDVEAKESTCTEEGWNKHQHCNDCGTDVNKIEKPLLGHTAYEQPKTESTCSTHGWEGRQICSTCGEVVVEGTQVPLNPDQHEKLSWIEGKEATCSEGGYEAHQHCDSCNKDVGTFATYPKLDHVEKTIPGIEATCTSDGKTEEIVCANCGEHIRGGEVISKDSAAHSDLVTVAAKAKTCTEDGWNEYQHCNACNTDVGKVIDVATGHNEVAHGMTPSTCVTHGWADSLICTICNKVTSQGTELPLDPDNHETLTTVVEKQATCQEEGYGEHQHCEACNKDVGEYEIYEITGHTQKNEVKKAATCTSTGLKNIVCGVCGIVLIENIVTPKLAHDYQHVDEVPATCVTDGISEHQECSVCGEKDATDEELKLPALGHEFVKGKCKYCDAEDPDYVPDPDAKLEKFALNVINNSNGILATDKAEYSEGDTAQVTIQGRAVGNNIQVVKSVVIDNSLVITQDQLLNKGTWLAENSIYKRKMGQSATSVEFDNVVSSITEGTTIEIADVTADTKVVVEFEELVPVYRLYNQITSEHLFTTNKTEYDKFVSLSKTDSDSWIGEGINWFAPKTGNVVHRLYNEGLGRIGKSSHYYTADEAEIANLLTQGWTDDGESNQFMSGGDVSIWTCYNEGLGSAHHYTASKTEWLNLKVHGWDLEEDKNGTSGVFHAMMSAAD